MIKIDEIDMSDTEPMPEESEASAEEETYEDEFEDDLDDLEFPGDLDLDSELEEGEEE